MKIGVPKEIRPGERRVAATPESVNRLVKLGFEVMIQKDAGEGAAFPDSEYEKVGARLVPTARELWANADIVLKVQPPEANAELGQETELLREGATLVSLRRPCSRWTKSHASRAPRRWTR